MAKHRHQRVLLRQPRAASRYVLLLLGLLASRALAAKSCSRCPNTYDPVVDDATGKPFYNKCLAQCQLPANAKLSKTSKAGEPDFLQLMPTPAADALASAAEVTGDVINRFAEEGFFYVGRPGNGPDPKGSQGNASGNKTKDDNDSRSKTAKGSPSGTSALLRFTLPEGDMYIKVVTKKDEDELKAKYQGPEWVRLAEAVGPAESGDNGTSNSSGSGAPVGHNDTSNKSTGRPARRLLRHAPSYVLGGSDDRVEVTNPWYPYTAVSLIEYTNSAGGGSMCSGAMIGPTGRLVLTAAHCIYDLSTGRTGSNFWVSPATTEGGSKRPFGTHPVMYIEVHTGWITYGAWSYDIGLLALAYHIPADSLGWLTNPPCWDTYYALSTAGYPGDKTDYSMWAQQIGFTTNVCQGDSNKNFFFDNGGGQSGSAFWTQGDNTARAVVSNGGATFSDGTPRGNGAVFITPSMGWWILDFSYRTILTTPTRILVGGGNRDLFVRCDTSTWRCTGVRSRWQATQFYDYKIWTPDGMRSGLQIPGTTLCLDVWPSWDVNLWTCNTDQRFRFPSWQQWINGPDSWSGGITTFRSSSRGILWWTGDNQQLRTVGSCWWAWQCQWSLEAP